MVTEEPRVPVVEIWHGTATPSELSAFDQTQAAARDDLAALRANFATAARAMPNARQRVIARYVLGLYEWDHLHLAMALTAALNELEKRDG